MPVAWGETHSNIRLRGAWYYAGADGEVSNCGANTYAIRRAREWLAGMANALGKGPGALPPDVHEAGIAGNLIQRG